ncbi:MAG TPA: PQQ-dependent sugar dehydrogenase [Geminicoccaceae bacterium]
MSTPAFALNARLDEVVRGLTMPVTFSVLPDGSGRWLIAEQTGRVRLRARDGELLETPFLDLRAQIGELYEGFDERGLLGLAVHPDFAENGLFYVAFNGPPPAARSTDVELTLWQQLIVFLKELRGRESPALDYWNGAVYLVERRVSPDDPDRADPDYARVLLVVEEPQFNHNGGWIDFGPDGHLYLGLGDGGNADDVGEGHAPEGNAQATDRLLGKILRIDVHGDPYRIPDDNPFVDREGYRPEIWALGFRNPWRCSFDAGGDHQLFCGDVGQNAFEEVSIVEKGGNYGWRRKEGAHCFDVEDVEHHPASCPDDDLIDPIIEYRNCTGMDPCQGRSVIGGYVYRGEAMPDLQGRYVFGDLVEDLDEERGVIFVATPPSDGSGPWPFEKLDLSNAEALGYLLAFGEDEQGELYVMTSPTLGTETTDDKIYRIAPAPDTPATAGGMKNGSPGAS